MLVTQGFAVFFPLSILLHKFTIIFVHWYLFIRVTMGTKASIHVIEVSLKRMPANADLFLDLMSHSPNSGLLIFRGKKSKISRDFQGQIRGKIGQFRGKKVIIRGKNRPISRDFRGRKVKIRRKIVRFRGILAEKSQISKDFQGKILRKIGRFPGLFHGKFRGETLPRNNRQKTADFAGFFLANFAKVDQFCVDMTSVV